MQIPLFAIGIGFNLTVLAGSGCGVQQFLNTRRRDLQAGCTVKRDIEPIPVVGFVGDEVQECAFVQDNWINRMIHIHRVLGDRSGGFGDVPEGPGVEPLDPKSDAKVEVLKWKGLRKTKSVQKIYILLTISCTLLNRASVHWTVTAI